MAKKKPAAKPTRAGRSNAANQPSSIRPARVAVIKPTPASSPASSSPGSESRPSSTATKTVVHPGRCIKCQSTKHTGYRSIRTMQHLGEIHGQPYTQIRWKRTNCADCGQARVDIYYEYRPSKR